MSCNSNRYRNNCYGGYYPLDGERYIYGNDPYSELYGSRVNGFYENGFGACRPNALAEEILFDERRRRERMHCIRRAVRCCNRRYGY